MTKAIHKSKRKAVETIAAKAKARRRACVMKPEYLAEIERFRLMDDDFMSKCLENAPECIELMLQIILGKKDLKVVKSQTEYPIKSLQGRGVRFDVFARDSKGREYDIEIQRADRGAEPKRARYNWTGCVFVFADRRAQRRQALRRNAHRLCERCDAKCVRHWQVGTRLAVSRCDGNVF